MWFQRDTYKEMSKFLTQMEMELFSLEEDDTKNLFITQFITQVSFWRMDEGTETGSHEEGKLC